MIESSSSEGCRVAPYVNMPSLRLAFDRFQVESLGNIDPLRSPLPSGLPAGSGSNMPLPSMFFYPSPLYTLGLSNLAAQKGVFSPKNTSIADLRLKAKQHAATLGLT